jgi:hypothetical protein
MVHAAGNRKDGGIFREIAGELIDAMVRRGSCDQVVNLAARMPTALTCERSAAKALR